MVFSGICCSTISGQPTQLSDLERRGRRPSDVVYVVLQDPNPGRTPHGNIGFLLGTYWGLEVDIGYEVMMTYDE